MIRPLPKLIIPALLLLAFAADVLGCTTFCLKNGSEILFGKNYDWMIGDGLIFVNKRGVTKTSIDASQNGAEWTSKFGSVTFNQYGWESPSGGMNEAGLVIELMWLDETQWPARDTRPEIGVLEWIQYHLDTAATTEEVIANAEKIRISSQVKLHYLVNDKTGKTAAIEFLHGKLVVNGGKELEFAALANDSYARSAAYARDTLPAFSSESSLDRFTRAAKRAAAFEGLKKNEKEAVEYAFETLANVAQRHSTQWSIVYDQKRSKVYFRTRRSPQIKRIDAGTLDYSCGSLVQILDVDSDLSGDATKAFADYTREANRDLIERAFNGTDFLRAVPGSVRGHYAEFPERFGCGFIKPIKSPDIKNISQHSAWTRPHFIFNSMYAVYLWATNGS